MSKVVSNVIHGQHDCVNFICDHPDIRAISFVGGDVAGKSLKFEFSRQKTYKYI